MSISDPIEPRNTPSSTEQPTRLVETRLERGFFKLEHPDLEKPRHLNPAEKIALQTLDAQTTEKALSRQETCWSYDCERPSIVWVRLVGFDFKGSRADLHNHIQISSADLPGPVPGFCVGHIADGPRELAFAVYQIRPEIQWGASPSRWIVEFTDGMHQAGEIVILKDERRMSDFKDDGIRSEIIQQVILRS